MTTAEFRKGQADGVAGVLTVITNVINGTDKGENRVASNELEQRRRVLLMWRDHIIESSRKDKNSMNVLLETKKIMDIKVK
jgi:hypothetical protein